MPLKHHLNLVSALFRKEVLMEWRQQYALNGIFLYVVSTVFVVYLAFEVIELAEWISLFWIIVLFASINAVAKSFLQETRGRMLYFFTLVGAGHYLMAKMLYNALLLLALTLLTHGVFLLLLGNPITALGGWLILLVMGSLGFAFTFTMVSAIASKARNNATLMAILSFPVILPQLSLLVDASKVMQKQGALAEAGDSLAALGAIIVIVLVVSFLLFPYLWRE